MEVEDHLLEEEEDRHLEDPHLLEDPPSEEDKRLLRDLTRAAAWEWVINRTVLDLEEE